VKVKISKTQNNHKKARFPKFEQFFLLAIISPIMPILFTLAGWWGSIPFVAEENIVLFALGGLCVGVLADLFFLKKWVRNAFIIPVFWLVLAYLFYSIGIFGFFMGVPVFNPLLGPVAGTYMGMRARSKKADAVSTAQSARHTALFTTAVLTVVCATALLLAMNEPTLEANIQGMFGLRSPLPRTAILWLSTAAGLVLVVVEYPLTRVAFRIARADA